MSEEIDKLLSDVLRAICLTRDHVGEETLPAVDGWSWYEAAKAIIRKIPADEWSIQFSRRTGFCPQCESRTGIKMIHNGDIYCEDCGWPNEYFGE